jgi:hypothetical protein
METENYSPLVHSTNKYGGLFKSVHYSPMREMGDSYQHIYITSDEEIKGCDWYLVIGGIGLEVNTCHKSNGDTPINNWLKKIILTTDTQLIKDGIQPIDNEFLEWFVKNPSCERVEIESWQTKGEWDIDYKIIIPKDEAKERAKNYMSLKGALEPNQIKCYCGHTTMCDCGTLDEPRKETLEEFALKNSKYTNHSNINHSKEEAIILGAKWQQERMYSEEQAIEFFIEGYRQRAIASNLIFDNASKMYAISLFEQFKNK